jgi:hypothetical protein
MPIRIDTYLDLKHNAALAQAKTKERKAQSLCHTAWILWMQGEMEASEYIKICTQNGQLSI